MTKKNKKIAIENLKQVISFAESVDERSSTNSIFEIIDVCLQTLEHTILYDLRKDYEKWLNLN